MDYDVYVAEIMVGERLREVRAQAQRAALITAARPRLSDRLRSALRGITTPAWRRGPGLAPAGPPR